VRGSFTGAHADSPGLVETARGGTLFIDEIADLSSRAQVRLLRFIEQGTYRRLGETQERRAEVRIVVAANKRLEGLVVTGHFRQDLLERIKGFCVTVPPLRDRGRDIVRLARHFIGRASGGTKRLSAHSEAELREYAWPGNVRELQMEMRRAAVLADSSVVEWRRAKAAPARDAAAIEPAETPTSLHEAVGGFERMHLKSILSQCAERVEAARMLGISRQTLHQKIVRYGL
jgi:DNA-binding NtrC family response regulator